MNVFAETPTDIMEENILQSWRRADAKCRRQGRAWYDDEHKFVVMMAATAGISVERMAAIVAVLSPRSSWGTCKRNAQAVAEARWDDVKGLPNNVAKALRIIDGEDPTNVVRGPKVLAFWSNLEDPKLSKDVTIDTWAAGVALGRRLSNAELVQLNATQYRRVAEAYRAVARRLRIRPHVLQAVTWCEMRNGTGWGQNERNN